MKCKFRGKLMPAIRRGIFSLRWRHVHRCGLRLFPALWSGWCLFDRFPIYVLNLLSDFVHSENITTIHLKNCLYWHKCNILYDVISYMYQSRLFESLYLMILKQLMELTVTSCTHMRKYNFMTAFMQLIQTLFIFIFYYKRPVFQGTCIKKDVCHHHKWNSPPWNLNDRYVKYYRSPHGIEKNS